MDDVTEMVLQDTAAGLLPVGSHIVRAIPIDEIFNEGGR